MAVKAELREFFLRNIQVRNGSMKDREINYPVKHFVNKYFIENGVTEIRKIEVGNRFLKGNVPSDEIYEKLFQSIPFIENVSDIATNTKAGLVRIANTTQLASGLEKDDQGFILVPTAKQLAEKANLIVTGPSVSGNFITNDAITYNIKTKIVNKLLYIDIAMTAPLNAVANQQVILNFTTINMTHVPANSIFAEQYIYTIGALQSNKTIILSINKLNKLNSVETTKVTYETGWKLLI